MVYAILALVVLVFTLVGFSCWVDIRKDMLMLNKKLRSTKHKLPSLYAYRNKLEAILNVATTDRIFYENPSVVTRAVASWSSDILTTWFSKHPNFSGDVDWPIYIQDVSKINVKDYSRMMNKKDSAHEFATRQFNQQNTDEVKSKLISLREEFTQLVIKESLTELKDVANRITEASKPSFLEAPLIPRKD